MRYIKNLRARKVDRSLLHGESFELFSAAIRSPATRDPYERKLLGFLKRVNQTPDEFAQFAKENPSAAEKKIISLLSQDRLKIERGEVTAGTINNWLKAVRLFLEMNDIVMNWKKIKRMLPMIRRYALDRVPTLEEVREILDAADIRGKALTLVLVSSGIREGAVPSLRVSDYSKLRTAIPDGGSNLNSINISNSNSNNIISNRGQQLVAGKLAIYHGEPEGYSAFISPEACIALDRYLDFRREHGEQISDSSPLFRDKFDPVEALDNDKLLNNNNSNCSNYSEEVTFHTKGRSIKNEKKIHQGHTSHNTLVLPITEHSIRQYYNRLLRSIGIRKERKKRHEFSVHGFRKYFKTKAELAGVKPAAVEMLMGHSLGSVNDSYFKPSESEQELDGTVLTKIILKLTQLLYQQV
jgi:integrase